MKDTTQVHVPHQAETQRIPNGELKTPTRTGEAVSGSEESFQAKILIVNNGTEVAKVYERIHLFELVDLRDDEQRDALMRREVTCINSLSASMNARVEDVMMEGGRIEKAIVMKRLQAQDFLFRRVQNGEALNPSQLETLARTMANFHFNPASCPVQNESLTAFFTRLLATEKTLLSARVDNNQDLLEKISRLFTTMERFIQDNTDRFDVIGKRLDEPVLGHGDLKSLNMVFEQGGGVHVLDVAPLTLWQVNTRRMDAMFFTAEMKLIGRESEATTFFERYDREYRKLQADAGNGYDNDTLVRGVVEKLDTVAEFYRYIIFFRLTFIGVNPERAPRCCELLDKVVDEAAASLYR